MNGPRLFRVRPKLLFVINRYGRFGTAFAETGIDRANYETTIADLRRVAQSSVARGDVHPVTDRAEDVSPSIAQEILRRLALKGRNMPSELKGFIDRHVSRARQLTLGLA